MAETKERLVSFRPGDVYFNRLNELAHKLGVNKSEAIRLMLDLGFKEYLDKKGPLLVVNNEKWSEMLEERVEDVKFNRIVEKRLNHFTENFATYMKNPELMATFTEFLKVVTSKLKPKGANVKADVIDIPEKDLSEWIDTALRGDIDSFNTKDINPEAQKVKEMILKIVRKAKGRID